MENGFKLRVSKLFQSSFNSCRTKPTSDVADQPFFFPENHHHRQLIDLFSPKPHPFPVSRKSKPHISTALFPAVKVAGKPDSVSISPPENRKNSKTAKKKKPHHRKPIKIQDFSSITDNYYYDFCSSDEDDQNDDESHETTLFSSRSFSSDSSASFRKNRATRRKNKNKNKSYKTTVIGGGGGGCKDRKSTDVIPIKGVGKLVKDSVAIVKKSSDPHEDFRVSMLEMIVERQILGAKDLEELLLCFLSLNSEEHHGVICEVFAEIWETLFSDWF